MDQVPLTDLIPSAWLSAPTTAVWATAFEMALVDDAGFTSGGHSIDLGDVTAVMAYGRLKYFDAGKLESRASSTGAIALTGVVVGMKETEVGAWLLLMTPLSVDGGVSDEPSAKQRISSAAGMCAVICGRNTVFSRVFDNIVRADGSTSAFTAVVENPAVLPRPDLGSKRLDLLTLAAAAVQEAEPNDQNRLRLSLHWYESALRSTGIDAFLKSWIALEVLAMPDSTNIKTINEALSAVYEEPLNAVSARYNVGRLFGIRSRIVHQGEMIPIHYLLEAYLQAIYSDVLCHRLGIPTQADAETLLAERAGELEPLIRA